MPPRRLPPRRQGTAGGTGRPESGDEEEDASERGGAVGGAAALFSAVAGGATGVTLRVRQDRWWMLEERAESAIATREIEATRRVAEERLRIARDLHDVIGHQAAMLSMHLGGAEIGLPEGAE